MDLQVIASKMTGDKKGILAADESTGTCDKRFDSVGVKKNEENRRLYRKMLFETDDIEKYIGGVILFEETLDQKTDDGVTLPELLFSRGILPGIKVDKGVATLEGSPTEKHTNGLEGLTERLQSYAKKGAKFAKWRAVITISGNELPSELCIKTNALELAQYAALCQKEGIVPIVEPEVLMDGDHTIERCQEVIEKTLDIVFSELKNHNIQLNGIVLKPSMVISGKDCPVQAGTPEIAERTVATLKKCVPAEVPGIAFLSGGQTEIQATENLNEMNRIYPEAPWRLTFSYGRALQASALNLFAEGKIKEAQESLKHHSQMNSEASLGEYDTRNE
jgi:fructose-bisphosphate aldolase class I